jgi:hypothetical protein
MYPLVGPRPGTLFVAALTLALLFTAGVEGVRADAPPRPGDEPPPSPWHFDLDVGYGKSAVDFVVPASYAGLCEPVVAPSPDVPPDALPMPPAGCTLPKRELGLLRTTLGLGHGGFTFEGSVHTDARFLGADGETAPYLTWSAGVRLDTSWDGLFALSFRFAYVRRETRGLEGEGGRASIGTLIRLAPWLVIYGEAAVDLMTVPAPLRDAGVLFSYTSWFGGGLRFEFGH